MTRFAVAALLFLSVFASGQKSLGLPCEYSTDVKDSLGTYKSTKDFVFYEKVFGNSASRIFFSLVKTDELPTLNVTFIAKSNDFIKANCLDKNSRMYLQLANGKIVTLMHIDRETCGTVVHDQKGMNNRVQTGIFMFVKDSFDELEKSPITLMRIRYGAETIDYIVKSEFVSEQDGKTYRPESYFIDSLHCILD